MEQRNACGGRGSEPTAKLAAGTYWWNASRCRTLHLCEHILLLRSISYPDRGRRCIILSGHGSSTDVSWANRNQLHRPCLAFVKFWDSSHIHSHRCSSTLCDGT